MVLNKENKETKVQRILEGEVVSDKMDKTIVVKVTRSFSHPEFGKTIRQSKKYKVHDEEQIANVGDIVQIVECRPLSKTKHMRLGRVLKQRSGQGVRS